jgi:hypothetical protein
MKSRLGGTPSILKGVAAPVPSRTFEDSRRATQANEAGVAASYPGTGEKRTCY